MEHSRKKLQSHNSHIVKPASQTGKRPVEVWMIEDNHAFRNTVSRLLNQTEEIRCTNSFPACEDALTLMDTGATVDVLLLDVELSGMNGIDGLRKIKAISPATRVVMLTVFEDHERVFRAICAGASGYLLKASPFDRIVDSVHQVMAGGSPMSPRVATSVLEMFTRMAEPKTDFGLTEREREVLELMKEGLTKKEIAGRLELSFHTVDDYLRNIYAKLHVHSQAGAVAKAMKHELF
jgi:DNA-binding NarL/FixJ family response regulator